jgi:hypothetical protein
LSLLCGCSGTHIVYSDSYVYGQDSQYSFRRSDTGGMAETTEGYYLVAGPAMLYYYDKANKKTIPVCNKPNCLHADEPDLAKIAKCNAFLGGGPLFLKYYENAIYYILDDFTPDGLVVYTLNKISLDGTKHQRISILKDYPQDLQIHRGYLYYSTKTWADDNATDCKLCRLPLNNVQAEPEIIEETREFEGIIASILCYGNHVYYIIAHYTDPIMEKHIGAIKRYNILTKAVSTFISDPDVMGAFTVFNGKFIYPVDGQGTYSCDLDGLNITKISDKYGINLAGENYLYIDNLSEAKIYGADRLLTVLNKNCQLIKTISLKGMKESPLGCADDCYFISDSSTSNDFGPIISFYSVRPDESEPKIFFQFVPEVKYSGIVSNN